MTIEKISELVTEQVVKGNLTETVLPETIRFIIHCLAYEWQNGGEAEIIQLFKQTIKSGTKSVVSKDKLPGRFEDLVKMMPPRAIQDEVQYDNTIEVLDRLTSLPRMTQGQNQYLETLSVLVEAYENEHYAIKED